MRRGHRVAALVLAALIGSTGAAVVATPASATPAATTAAAPTSALQDLGACLLGRRHGDVLLLVDASQSLQKTDPDAARVTAARYLGQRFVDVAARNKLTLDLAVSDFASGYEQLLPWTRLTAQSFGRTVAPTVDVLAHRDTGFETDYWTALDGARQQLADKAKADGGPDRTCQMVIWVTDGRYELSARTSAQERSSYGETKSYAPTVHLDDDSRANAVVTTGRRDLCRVGGLADAVRSSGVRTLAIGLETPTARGDFDFLRAVATGRGAPARCGAITTPTPGDFARVSSLDDLLFEFNRIGAQPPTESQPGVCVQTFCERGTVRFVLDSSIQSVRVLAGTQLAGITIQVRAPGVAAPLSFTYSADDERRPVRTASVGGLPVGYQWQSPRTIAISMSRQQDTTRWTGQWSITFVSPGPVAASARARTQLEIQGDLVPAWLNKSSVPLRAGQVVHDLQLGVVRAESGEPVGAGDILGTVRLTAGLQVADGSHTVPVVTNLPKTGLGAARDLDLRNVPLGPSVLRLRLQVTTAGVPASGGRPAVPGTQLSDQVQDVPVDVLAPPNFPIVPRGTVDFGKAEDEKALTASIPVTGSGCVWLSSARIVAVPLGVGGARVSADRAPTQARCLAVRGGRVDLPLSISRDAAGIGSINGTLQIGLASADVEPETSSVVVPFTAEVTRSPITGIKWLVFLIGLLGLALPVAVAYLAKWYSARVPGRPLVAVVLPVTVADGQVLSRGRPLEVSHEHADQVGGLPRKGARRLAVPAAEVVLRTRPGLNPATPGHVDVEAGVPSASGTRPYTDRRGTSARLPLAVHNTWVVLRDGPGDLRLLVLVSAVATDEVLRRLTQKIQDDLPARAEALSAAVAEAHGDAHRGGPDDDGLDGNRDGPDAGPGGGPRGGGRRTWREASGDGHSRWDEPADEGRRASPWSQPGHSAQDSGPRSRHRSGPGGSGVHSGRSWLGDTDEETWR